MWELKGRWTQWAWVLVLALWAAPCSMARTVLDLDTKIQPVPLLDWGDSWIDATGKLPVEAIAQGTQADWQPTRANATYPLTNGGALWIRFVIPPAPDAERWYLEVPYASVDRVTLYTRDSVGNWSAQTAGDSVAVSAWPVPHRHPLLPLSVSAEVPRSYLVRVENSHHFSAPLSFVSESHIYRSEQRVSLFLGIYFGLAGLAVTLSMLSALSLRDKAYAAYAVAVTLMGLTQASLTGIAGLHLWPNSPRLNDALSFVLPVLTLSALLWFTTAATSLFERSRSLHRLLLALAGTGVVVAMMMVIGEPGQRPGLIVMFLTLATLTGVSAQLWAWRRGDRFALMLLLGSVPVIVAAAFPMARMMGWTPVSFMTVYGMQIAIALELPMVLVILMIRSAQRREHNRRIQGLDRMDPATGLMNSYVFAAELVRMIARSARLRQKGAVLLIDIVNFNDIEHQFDRQSAQELPLRVAGRLLSTARDIDAVARLSERRFGMLIEGPLTPEEIAQAGPRIVARGLMPFKNKPLAWVAQLRVAQAVVPRDGSDAQSLVAQLYALLTSAPADSKRAVYSLQDAPSA